MTLSRHQGVVAAISVVFDRLFVRGAGDIFQRLEGALKPLARLGGEATLNPLAFADCKRHLVEFTRGAPKLFESSPGVRRGFCGECGSTLTYESADIPDEIHIHIGALDRPEDFPPRGSPAFPEERLPWFRIAGVD